MEGLTLNGGGRCATQSTTIAVGSSEEVDLAAVADPSVIGGDGQHGSVV